MTYQYGFINKDSRAFIQNVGIPVAVGLSLDN
jgi:hypothetical protein